MTVLKAFNSWAFQNNHNRSDWLSSCLKDQNGCLNDQSLNYHTFIMTVAKVHTHKADKNKHIHCWKCKGKQAKSKPQIAAVQRKQIKDGGGGGGDCTHQNNNSSHSWEKNKAADKRRVFEVALLMQVKVGEAIGAPGRRSDCLTRPHQVGQQPSWFSLSFSIQDSACVPVCFSSGWVGEKGWEVGKRQPGNSPQRLSLKPPLPHLTLCPGSPDKPTNTHTRA